MKVSDTPPNTSTRHTVKYYNYINPFRKCIVINVAFDPYAFNSNQIVVKLIGFLCWDSEPKMLELVHQIKKKKNISLLCYKSYLAKGYD